METTDRSKNLKKKRLTVLFSVIAVAVILALLNTIDFTPATTPTSTAPYTPDTQPIQNFYPAPEGDIMKDKTYLALDRTLNYTFGTQTVIPDATNRYDSPYDNFFLRYFDALQKGDENALNALHSPIFFRTHGRFSSLSPQMVHDIKVLRLSDPVTVTEAESEEDRAYLGASLITFEVRYKIFKNDGSFRRDIVDDEVIAQIFTLLLEKNGTLTLNKISYYRPSAPLDPDSDPKTMLSLVMPLVWLAATVIAGVLTLILKKKKLPLALAVGAFSAFLASTGLSLLFQIPTFLIVFGGVYFLVPKLIKKKTRS